jgi:hypothetical protein
LVFPAGGLVQVARESGTHILIVNPDPTAANEIA